MCGRSEWFLSLVMVFLSTNVGQPSTFVIPSRKPPSLSLGPVASFSTFSKPSFQEPPRVVNYQKWLKEGHIRTNGQPWCKTTDSLFENLAGACGFEPFTFPVSTRPQTGIKTGKDGMGGFLQGSALRLNCLSKTSMMGLELGYTLPKSKNQSKANTQVTNLLSGI